MAETTSSSNFETINRIFGKVYTLSKSVEYFVGCRFGWCGGRTDRKHYKIRMKTGTAAATAKM